MFIKKSKAFLIISALAFLSVLIEQNFSFSPVNAEQESKAKPAEYTLALTWHRGFCLFNDHKKECDQYNVTSYAEDNFVLHGLWPGPKGQFYCGADLNSYGLSKDLIDIDKRSSNWRRLPDMKLPSQIKQELFQKMPGAQSFLHRHEWIKHGTCFHQRDPISYYKTSFKLQDFINHSLLKNFIMRNKGKNITLRQLQSAFDTAYGKGAGNKIYMRCKSHQGRMIVTELRINLYGSLSSNMVLNKEIFTQLIENSSQLSGSNCKSGQLI